MALTDYDKKNLSSGDQKKIQDATNKWNAANAKGDKAGMAAAAAEAAAVRNKAGYKTDSSGNYSGSSGGGSSKNTYSPYTNSGGTIDYGTVGKNQMASGAHWKDVLATYNSRYNKAITTEGLQQYAKDKIQDDMLQYILDGIEQDNQQKYKKQLREYERDNPKPEYESKYDPQIDELLNQILSRDDFSYDVAKDPLYQQYAQMYQREGDRAMRETLAEAAAGAGGMNTYAITAAQQANNYYNSQLNDKIPQLYQLAYDMYINDKESKVQDLGILQNMDEAQYSRYRDAMNDYYNDKNFAYGAYQDAVAQGNWQTNFAYNSMLDNRDFVYNQEQDKIANDRHDREWDYKVEQDNIANDRYEREAAKDEVKWLISLGITPDAELIAKSEMNPETVAATIAEVKAEQEGRNTVSSGGIRSGGGGYTPKGAEIEGVDLSQWEGSQNYQTIKAACEELSAKKGKSAVLSYLTEAKKTGAIDQTSFMLLYNKYRG